MSTLLNPQQQDAVRHLSTPLLVLAGAGSGKTRVITHKISYLVEQCNIKPNKIVAVTFTNKSAKEMSDRVKRALPDNNRGLTICTFHALGLKIIRSEYTALSLKANPSIYDSEDVHKLLREFLHIDSDAPEELSLYQTQISNWKNAAVNPETALSTAKNEFEACAAKLYIEYQKALSHYNAIDFDDLLLRPVQLFSENPNILEKWQNKIQYLLVDEYQDTNIIQYQFIKLIAGARGAFTMVGDDHQSIYAWRGANPENLLQLKQDYPTLTTITLEQNYRSTGNILNAANQLISNNPALFRKNLWSTLGSGDPIRIIVTQDEQDETDRVATEILSHKFQNSGDFHDYAVLYRSNHQSRLLEKSLRAHHIPYRISGGTSFFARTEVKDILAYLKILTNPDDDIAFLRIVNTPRREIGPSTLEKLSTYATQRSISLFEASFEFGLEQTLIGKPLLKLRHFTHWLALQADNIKRGDPKIVISDIMETIDYKTWLVDTCSNPIIADKRMEHVNELLEWVNRLIDNPESPEESCTLEEAITKILFVDLLSKQETDSAFGQVHLLTLHAAKGLEFPHVFIMGVEEDNLPHKNSVEEDSIEEERRLAYVGLTRAQKTLTLTLANQRQRFKEAYDCKPSRFLSELPENITQWEGLTQQQNPEERQQKGRAQLSAIKSLLSKKTSEAT